MGTRSNRLIKAVLSSTHNLCFEQKYEKYQIFLSENFLLFFVGKIFSTYMFKYACFRNEEVTDVASLAKHGMAESVRSVSIHLNPCHAE